MTIDEQIKILESNAEFERKEGDLQGCLNFRQLAEWLKELKRHREAWIVVANAMKECSYKIWHEFGEYVGENCEQLEIINLKTALDILEDYRPKEGENE